MFIRLSSDIIDYDLQMLKEILHLLDTQLRRIDREAEEYPDPEGFGFYDLGEATIGLGFVACQQYLSATYGWLSLPKKSALLAGPKHYSGLSIAEIINHSANYWKHCEEWQVLGKPSKRTGNALQKLGFTFETDYVLSNVLAEVVSPGPTCLRSLIPHLEAWRDALAVNAS
jgi:hypothetical protein